MPQLLNYLQLQPVEPDDDGTSSSPLDDYQHDDVIDLSDDVDGESLLESWQHIVDDTNQPKTANTSDE